MEKPKEKHTFCISVKGQERRKKKLKDKKLEFKKGSEIWRPKGAQMDRFWGVLGTPNGPKIETKNESKKTGEKSA